MKAQTLPKILIISHNCFSLTGSNGRTLGNFFQSYPKEMLAQLYVVKEYPNYELCENYFQITDKAVLKANLTFSSPKNTAPRQEDTEEVGNGTSFKRTAKTALLREIVWRTPLWKRKGVRRWVDEFQPDIILFQAGNLGYLCTLARKMAKQRGIPLIVYNTEGYFLKRHNFFDATKKKSFAFWLYMRLFRKSFAKMMKSAAQTIYISKHLQDAYNEKITGQSTFVMTSYSERSVEIRKGANKNNKTTITYIGNLDLGRHESLKKIASILGKIDDCLELTIYGKAEKEEILNELKDYPHIKYCGFVPYEEVVRIISETDINLVVEGFDSFFVEDSKYAFSTKIADLLNSGKCLVCYASKELAFVQYLEENQAAHIITREEELEDSLRKILSQSKLRTVYERNAKVLALRNHNIKENQEKFLGVILSCYENRSN